VCLYWCRFAVGCITSIDSHFHRAHNCSHSTTLNIWRLHDKLEHHYISVILHFLEVFFISVLLSVNIASISAHGIELSSIPSVSRSVYWSAVWKVYCGKMAHWILIPFEIVSGVGWGMGVLDRGPRTPRRRGGLGVFIPHWFQWHICLTHVKSWQ